MSMQQNKYIVSLAATSVLFSSVAFSDDHYPVTVKSCQQDITFNQKPDKAVFNDLNIVQMALALDLQPQIAAVTGISGWYKTTPEFKKSLGDIPEISPKYLSLEPLVGVNPDFLFAGWNYGLRVGTELTPENFSRFGIQTYVLSESCAHVDKNTKPATMQLLYNDMLNLGKIFNKEDKAKALVAQWQQEINALHEGNNNHSKMRVFLYDSGMDKPFTSGRLAMPQALIEAAGGQNVMQNGDFSWRATSWEFVAQQNPELIILVDYNSDGAMTTDQLKEVLKQHPLMKHTDAVRNDRYLLLRYDEITPGPSNIEAVKKIAHKISENNPPARSI